MSPQNVTHLLGRLTRAPETREAGDYSVTDFGIAVNEKYGKKESVLFIDCEAWGKSGEAIAKYFNKGDRINVVGSLKLDQWEDRDSGAKRSKIKLNIQSFGFIESKGDSGSTPTSRTPLDESDIPF